MTISPVRGRLSFAIAMLLAAALAIVQPKQGEAAYLSLVACPSTHPYRPGIALERGDTEGMARRAGHEFGGQPLRDAPPDRYASNGWLYEIQEAFHAVEYLICVYADGSEVKYPLPDFTLRGTGRCDFVSKWSYPDDFVGEFITEWPYGLERKPMAICTFDFSARRTVRALRPN